MAWPCQRRSVTAYSGVNRAAIPVTPGQPFRRSGSRSGGRAVPRAGGAAVAGDAISRAVAPSVRGSRRRRRPRERDEGAGAPDLRRSTAGHGCPGPEWLPGSGTAARVRNGCPGPERLPGSGTAARVGRNTQRDEVAAGVDLLVQLGAERELPEEEHAAQGSRNHRQVPLRPAPSARDSPGARRRPRRGRRGEPERRRPAPARRRGQRGRGDGGEGVTVTCRPGWIPSDRAPRPIS
jgi:hypothetical protein